MVIFPGKWPWLSEGSGHSTIQAPMDSPVSLDSCSDRRRSPAHGSKGSRHRPSRWHWLSSVSPKGFGHQRAGQVRRQQHDRRGRGDDGARAGRDLDDGPHHRAAYFIAADEPRHHGLRTVQNWIGSSSWTPIGAAYIPPGPDRVPGLMTDLVDYLNGAAHAPLIQAAVAHAQFEAIHPFTDGNGRVGRALIHTVLARRGLTDRAVLPISLVLATLHEQYVEGLSAFRHDSPPGSDGAHIAVNAWFDTFVGSSAIAVARSEKLVRDMDELRTSWTDRLTAHRVDTGLRPTLARTQRLRAWSSNCPRLRS